MFSNHHFTNLFLVLLLTAVCTATGCHLFHSDDDGPIADCGEKIRISPDAFDAETDFYTLVSATVEDRCLTVEINSSGCSGETWKVGLISDGAIAESLPQQAVVAVTLVNEELCDAVFVRAYDFDLAPLLPPGTVPTIVRFLDSELEVLVE